VLLEGGEGAYPREQELAGKDGSYMSRAELGGKNVNGTRCNSLGKGAEQEAPPSTPHRRQCRSSSLLHRLTLPASPRGRQVAP